MKKEQKQLSFSAGMIERIKQDFPNEVNPVFESSLWLENYNPNIQQHSLIMRSEESNNFHAIHGSDILEVGEYSKLAKASYSAYSITDPSEERLREILVASNLYMQVVQPFYNDNYIAFIRRFSNGTFANGQDYSPHAGVSAEATAVVAWVPFINSGGSQDIGWREPFHDSEQYPGWYALGTIQDAARYGETVIFVTRLLRDMAITGLPGTYDIEDSWSNKMYPCYVWQWWDLHNKRSGLNGSQKFWNGLDIGDIDDPKYRLWRIRKPSMALVRDNIVEAIHLKTVGGDLTTHVWKKKDGVTAIEANSSPVQLMIWESPMQTFLFESYANGTMDLFADLKIADFDFRDRASYVNPFFTNKTLSFIDSIETLDIEGLYETNAIDVTTRRVDQNVALKGVRYTSEVVPFPYRDPNTYDSGAWTFDKNFGFRHMSINARIGNGTRTLDMMICNTEDRGSDWQTQPQDPLGDTDLEQTASYRDPFSGNEATHGDTAHAKVGEYTSCYTAVGTKMPNYLEAAIPRAWVQGELIPYLLTAVVNGVEVVVLKDIYRVSSQNYLFTPQLFSPMTWGDQNIETQMAVPYAATTLTAGAPYHIYGNGGSGVTISLNGLITQDLVYDEYSRLLAARISTASHHIALHSVYGVLGFTAPRADCATLGPVIFTGSTQIKHRVIFGYEPFNPTSELLIGNAIPVTSTRVRFSSPANKLARWSHFDHDTKSINYHPNYYHSDFASNYNMKLPVATDFRLIPYLPELCEGNIVHFGLRIKDGYWAELSSANVTAFNLYVSRPNNQDSILRSVGTIAVTDTPNGLYPKPAVTRDNIKTSQSYGLVKTFLIEGEGNQVTSNSWNSYSGSPLSTNAWKSSNGFAYAVPQNADGSARSSVPTFVDHNTAYTLAEASSWTPDFMLWDYPSKGKALSLNSSGDYWDGIGARLVAIIKGRTFLGGCIDKAGVEDVALIRYSDVQSGVAAQDLFSEERKMRIGHNAHTALVVYREQLWFFSRYDNYRLQMPNVFDESTWEWLDAVSAGTFSSKTVAETPYGLVYCNEAGVWISDGRMPENLATPILASYQKLIRHENGADDYEDFVTQPAYIGEYVDADDNLLIVRNGDSGINEYLECAYDTLHDELYITTPMWWIDQDNAGRWIPKREYRLIYNFTNKNWRVESYDLPETRME